MISCMVCSILSRHSCSPPVNGSCQKGSASSSVHIVRCSRLSSMPGRKSGSSGKNNSSEGITTLGIGACPEAVSRWGSLFPPDNDTPIIINKIITHAPTAATARRRLPSSLALIISAQLCTWVSKLEIMDGRIGISTGSIAQAAIFENTMN